MGGRRARGIAYIRDFRERAAGVRHGFAFLLFLGALGVLLIVDRYVDPSFAPPLLGAVALSAWVCGLGPALLVTAVSTVSFHFFFQQDTFVSSGAGSVVRLLFFIAVAVFLSVLINALTAARDQIAASEQRYRSVGELLPFGVWLADGNGSIRYLSESLLELVGKPAAAVHRWSDLAAGKDRDAIDHDWLRCVQSGKPWDREFEVEDAEGSVRAVLSRGTPVRDRSGKITSWVGFNLDMTERHHVEAERLQHNEDLARSNAELEQFAYVASHDLQEPLRTIRNYLTLIGRRYHGKLDSDADEFIHFAVDGAERLQRMINDLLQFSRAGRRALDLRAVEIEAVLTQATQNLQHKIEEAAAGVTWDELPRVRADENSLVQLFQNLIDNAIKYRSEAAPKIHISATSSEGICTVRVRDNGVGIDPKYAERIFKIFQRLHSREYPGTGIGLAVAKRIVERHGGTIRVESRKGEGATFVFTLRAAEQELVKIAAAH